jgi:biopolymer transport protein ExbB/TolQ
MERLKEVLMKIVGFPGYLWGGLLLVGAFVAYYYVRLRRKGKIKSVDKEVKQLRKRRTQILEEIEDDHQSEADKVVKEFAEKEKALKEKKKALAAEMEKGAEGIVSAWNRYLEERGKKNGKGTK